MHSFHDEPLSPLGTQVQPFEPHLFYFPSFYYFLPNSALIRFFPMPGSSIRSSDRLNYVAPLQFATGSFLKTQLAKCLQLTAQCLHTVKMISEKKPEMARKSMHGALC